MTLHWSLLVPGGLLLLFPGNRLLSSRVELQGFACFHNLENSPRFRPWWWVPALWLDPLRGFFGTLLILSGSELAGVPWTLTPQPEYALVLGMLALSVVSQLITRRGNPGILLAPIGFVAGVVAALLPWPVALIGLVTGVLGLFALRRFPAFFAFGFFATGLMGLLLATGFMWLGPALGLFALPLAAGLVTGRTLEIPVRNTSGRPGVVSR